MSYETTSYADIFRLTRLHRHFIQRGPLFRVEEIDGECAIVMAPTSRETVRASATDTFEFDGSKAWKDLRAVPKAILNSFRRKAKKVARKSRPRYMIPDRERTARYLSNAMFDRLRELQSNCCYLCDDPFTAEDGPTCDHVTPQAHGGKNAGNILLAHAFCNNAKDSRMPTPLELARLSSIKEEMARLYPVIEPDHSKEIAKHAAFMLQVEAAKAIRLAKS